MGQLILIVVGTRAEAIKLIPVYQALKQAGLAVQLCVTFQHAELLEQVLSVFGVTPDINLRIMKAGQDLFYVHQAVLTKMQQVYAQIKPSLVMVHGDTTTTMAAAMAAFYSHIPVAHVEAGLRTGNNAAPFPEEMNRKVVGQIAQYHFTPTASASANLLAEGVPREQVFLVGNTVVDALFAMKQKIMLGQVDIDYNIRSWVACAQAMKKKIVLLTAHRRESFDGGLVRVFEGIKTFCEQQEDIAVLLPLHPNPAVKQAYEQSGLVCSQAVHCVKPLNYATMVYVLMHSNWVVTDSGGLQEEASSLGKPVVCVRDHTERLEGVWEGSAYLVGTQTDRLHEALSNIYYAAKPASTSLLYGDGNACNRIVTVIKQKLGINTLSKYQVGFGDVMQETV